MIRLYAGLGLCAVVACGTADDAEPQPQRQPPAEASEATALPAAVLGEAAAPGGEAVAYFEADPAAKGYLAVPEGDGPHPAVILIHEWNGLNDRVRQVADALAAEGYVALAADLYSGRTGSDRDENMALVNEVQADMGTVVANLDAAQAYLAARPETTGRMATIGWCFGGGIALSYALGGEAHEGTAIFYGSLVTDPAELARIDHEVYGTFAEADREIPVDEVERFVAALREAGVPNDVHIYDAVDHGFWLWVDRDPQTNRDAAADAWRWLKAYLTRTLEEA